MCAKCESPESNHNMPNGTWSRTCKSQRYRSLFRKICTEIIHEEHTISLCVCCLSDFIRLFELYALANWTGNHRRHYTFSKWMRQIEWIKADAYVNFVSTESGVVCGHIYQFEPVQPLFTSQPEHQLCPEVNLCLHSKWWLISYIIHSKYKM